MKNDVFFSQEQMDKIVEGSRKLFNAVTSTLGPGGRTVVIQKEFGLPIITKDGVTVAKKIHLKNNLENIGVNIIREAAQRTNDECGDGTTTSTLLAFSLIEEGLKYVRAGQNAVDIKRGMNFIADKIIKKMNPIQIKSFKDVRDVALISSNGDEEIADIVTSAVETVGKNGVITIELSKTDKTYFEIHEGFSFDKGYLSPYFMTNLEKQTAEVENAYVFVTNHKISNLISMKNIIEAVTRTGRPLIIIADDVVDEALQLLVLNKLKMGTKIIAVKAPSFGQEKNDLLMDISAVVGAVFVDTNAGMILENCVPTMLGEARKITIKKDETTILDGKGTKEMIDARIDMIKNQIEMTQSNYNKEKLQNRLAKLSGGIGVIYVGAMTEVEMNEKKDRVEDALNATKSAIAEGIVEGGGIALLKASSEVFDDITNGKIVVSDLSEGEKIGISILLNACKTPFKKICSNAGIDDVEIAYKCVERNKGYDVKNRKFVDNMFEAKIVDPFKVVKNAFLNAISVASTFLTMNCAIVFCEGESIKKDMEENGGVSM